MGSRAGVSLLPYVTPLVWTLALAWMGGSWRFATAGVLFLALPTARGVLAHRAL